MRHIFAKTVFAGIVDADNDHWWNKLFANETICCFVDAPLDSGEGCRCFKQVLTVIQVEDRIAAARVLIEIVARRKPYAKKASVAENSAVKLVQAKVASRGLHTNHIRRPLRREVFSFLEFFHPAKALP